MAGEGREAGLCFKHILCRRDLSPPTRSTGISSNVRHTWWPAASGHMCPKMTEKLWTVMLASVSGLGWCYLGTAWAEEAVRLPTAGSKWGPTVPKKRNSSLKACFSLEPLKYLSGCLNEKPECPRRRKKVCAQETLCFQNMFWLFEVQVDFIGWMRCWLELAVTLFALSVCSTCTTAWKAEHETSVSCKQQLQGVHHSHNPTQDNDGFSDTFPLDPCLCRSCM